jgi:hypothetical protein
MSWGDVLVHQQIGPRFRKHRRIVQERFSARSLEKYASLQRQEVYITLSHLGSSPEHVLTHLKRWVNYLTVCFAIQFLRFGVIYFRSTFKPYWTMLAASIILNIAYGRTVVSHEDDLAKLADQARSETVSVTPAGMLVDFFPICMFHFTSILFVSNALIPCNKWDIGLRGCRFLAGRDMLFIPGVLYRKCLMSPLTPSRSNS